MVSWVARAAAESGVADQVVVATCDDEILGACADLGIEAVRTRPDHPSGTDRIAELAETIPADFYVNVQGDEPLIPPATIRACAEPLLSDPNIAMASVWSACSEDEGKSPHVVKVVLDQQGNALYFSRSEIPYPRSERRVPLRKHVGIYAYRREVVQAFSRWPMGALEASESLEQLRFLENGIAIRMVEGSGSPIAVDTPEQADEVRAWMLAQGMSGKSW